MQRYPHDLHDLYSDKIREMQRDVKKKHIEVKRNVENAEKCSKM